MVEKKTKLKIKKANGGTAFPDYALDYHPLMDFPVVLADKFKGNFGPKGKGDGINAIPRKADGGPADPLAAMSQSDLAALNVSDPGSQSGNYQQQSQASLDSQITEDSSILNPISNKPFPASATQTGINAAVFGLDFMKGIIDRRNENNINNTIKNRMTSDAFMPVTPGNATGNRGDYDVNSGAFRPDQLGAMSPTGMNNRTFADGGVYNSGLIPDQMNLHDVFGGGPVATPPSGPGGNPFNSFMPNAEKKPQPAFMEPAKPQPVNDNAKEAYQYYIDKHGLDPQTSAAIVGNLMQESDLKPTAKETGGNGRGIAQWDARDRWPAFQKWAKDNDKDPLDLHTQLDYVIAEPGWGQKALQVTGKAGNVQDATMAFGRSFERPNEKAAAWERRAGYAESLFQYPNGFEFGGEMVSDKEYKAGGQYDLSHEEIQYILRNGGQVEFL